MTDPADTEFADSILGRFYDSVSNSDAETLRNHAEIDWRFWSWLWRSFTTQLAAERGKLPRNFLADCDRLFADFSTTAINPEAREIREWLEVYDDTVVAIWCVRNGGGDSHKRLLILGYAADVCRSLEADIPASNREWLRRELENPAREFPVPAALYRLRRDFAFYPQESNPS